MIILKHLQKAIICLFFIFFCILISKKSYSQATDKTKWFKNSSYGLLVHYLFGMQNGAEPWSQGKTTSWDSCINSFNAEKFANDVAQTGAGYVIFTTQQNNPYFSCPNSTYEKLSGYKRGIATPKRDLINDIYVALHKKGISLMLYVTGNGPFGDPQAMAGLTNNNYRMRKDPNYGDVLVIEDPFLKSWASVLKDISLRYKSKIKGWWVDGAYPFIGYNDTSLSVLSKALKAGNKKAIVAFNPAPRTSISYYTKLDDYTAGEIYNINSYPEKRFIKQVQWHALTFLGKEWGQPGVRFKAKEVEDYLFNCNKKGGVVTLDVCLLRDGSLDIVQKEFLKKVKEVLKTKKG